MKLSTSLKPLKEQKKDALILFYQGESLLLPAGQSALKKVVNDLVQHSGFKGAPGQVAQFPLPDAYGPKQLIVAGLGDGNQFHHGQIERAAAAAVRTGCAAGLTSFVIPAALKIKGVTETDYQLLTGRGACWGTYAFTTFKSESKKGKRPTLTFAGKVATPRTIRHAEAQGTALCSTADLANLPGNEAPPRKIASWAKSMARKNDLTCRVLGQAELEKKGCGALLSVSHGSAEAPQLIILRNKVSNTSKKPIILVGKTVTFDTGGISLKPGKSMGWMRYDKCGGMAVLTAMQMIARMQLKTPVIGILGAVENMPGSKATRPGDIVKAYNGKTIEVLNTDAEGRLVLADAMGLAGEMRPAAIVDLATLTGACIVALGSAASAILGNDDKLVHELIKAGQTAGERLWQLPLYPEYTEDMKSDFADLSNLGKSGGAGTATAAAFLQEFVPEGVPWAHLDIAGTAWLESGRPYQAPGATLFGARLLTQWIAGME